MRVIAISTLKKFWTRHPDSEQALKEWYIKTIRAGWNSFNDMRKDSNSVDYVNNQRYVFNIKGNEYSGMSLILKEMNTVWWRQ